MLEVVQAIVGASDSCQRGKYFDHCSDGTTTENDKVQDHQSLSKCHRSHYPWEWCLENSIYGKGSFFSLFVRDGELTLMTCPYRSLAAVSAMLIIICAPAAFLRSGRQFSGSLSGIEP